MATVDVAGLVTAVRCHQLLENTPCLELERTLQRQFKDVRELGRELLQRDWLTAYQLNQLLLGRAQDLRIGPYLLLERLGEGGMGQVFKARHLHMRRLVAIKVLRPALLHNPVAVGRFQREVRAISQVAHPNIVRAFDADFVDGRHYCAMEFIEGTDLDRMVKTNGPLNAGQACEYIRQAALGLQHAFEQGLVHRDIKPANLVVTRTGVTEAPGESFHQRQIEKWGLVKILDLGLARILSGEGDEESLQLTRAGVVVGTPDYISPEQVRDSHSPDIRSDLYSLGCTFYSLLTGRVPFPEGTVTQRLLKHQTAEPAPVEEVRRNQLIARGANPDELKYLSSRVGKLVRQLLSKNPNERPQTPSELVAALTAVLTNSNSTIRKRLVPPLTGRLPLSTAERKTAPALVLPEAPPVQAPPAPDTAVDPDSVILLPDQPAQQSRWKRGLGFSRVLVAVGVMLLSLMLGRFLFQSPFFATAKEVTQAAPTDPGPGRAAPKGTP